MEESEKHKKTCLQVSYEIKTAAMITPLDPLSSIQKHIPLSLNRMTSKNTNMRQLIKEKIYSRYL